MLRPTVLSLSVLFLFLQSSCPVLSQGTQSARASAGRHGVTRSSQSSQSTSGTIKVSAQTSGHKQKKKHKKKKDVVQFPIDFSTTEASLRTYVFQSNVRAAARVLNSEDVISLGAGLTYPDKLSPLVEPSEDRNRDPDVVAFKALALSALDTHDANKLATAVVLSFRPDCQCSVLTSEETDRIRKAFAENFRDKARLKEIIKADANRELGAGGRSRRLLADGSSPVSSFVCSSCWPNNECNKMHWC